MAKAIKLTDKEQVTKHIQQLPQNIAPVVELLRQIILSVDKEVDEQIKWNNPSFYYTGEMKTFDPKEYKRDIVVFNLHKGRIMLVFPSGAKVNNEAGLLQGDYKDGRRTCIFKDIEEVKMKQHLLKKVINEWLKSVESNGM